MRRSPRRSLPLRRRADPVRAAAIAAAVALAPLCASCTGGSDVTVEKIPPAPAGAAAAPHDHGAHEGEGEGDAALPPGHPPIDTHGPAGAAPMAPHGAAAAETDGHPELPLAKSGIAGRPELDRGLAGLKSDEAKRRFEEGFRYAFTTRREARHNALAESELRRVIELEPGSAEAHRALGYAVFNRSGNMSAAIGHYRKAIEIDPEYGEAHYALSFLLAPQDREAGRVHFKKAMDLGVPDERGLGARFYPD